MGVSETLLYACPHKLGSRSIQPVTVWIISKSALAERFSAEFSNLNLAEVLAEFSLPSSLREHMDSLSSTYQLVSGASAMKIFDI